MYNAHNHGPLKEAARAGGLAVYVTNHAVAVRDDARSAWSWTFIGTDQMKLRFPTIVKAVTDGKLVAVERNVLNEGNEDRHVVVIDPRAGRYIIVPLRGGKRWSLDARWRAGSTDRPRGAVAAGSERRRSSTYRSPEPRRHFRARRRLSFPHLRARCRGVVP